MAYISISLKLFFAKILNSVSNLNTLYFLLKIEAMIINIKPIIKNKVISFVFVIFLNNTQILNQEL